MSATLARTPNGFCVPVQTSHWPSRSQTVQFIGSIEAWAR